MKTRRETPHFLQITQKYRALYMKFYFRRRHKWAVKALLCNTQYFLYC
jgi:hypothetical protein